MELTLDQALQRGIDAHKAGNINEAFKFYSAVLKAQPKHPHSNHNLGVLHVGIGKTQDAIPFFKKAIDVDPSYDQFWLSYIDALIKLNRIVSSRMVFNQAKEKGSKGDAFDQLDSKIAQAFTDQSLSSQKTLLGKAISLKKNGDFLSAISLLKDGLILFPKQAEIKALLSDCYNLVLTKKIELQQFGESILILKDLINISPRNENHHLNMSFCFQQLSQFDQALEALKSALIINPRLAEAYAGMAFIYKNQGNLIQAVEAYEAALSIKPEAKYYYNLGNALRDQDRLEDAITSLKKAIVRKPDYDLAYNNMGTIFKDQKKLDEAIECYEKCLKINPDNAAAYNNMGVCLQAQGDMDKAIKYYTKAVEINPGYTGASHLISAHNGITTTSAPREYVESLFDNYATKFDNSLVNKLEYKTPKILADVILDQSPNKSLGSVLDLGCGTGLVGVEIRTFSDKLIGVDLSNSMIEQANLKKVYDKLVHRDIIDYLSDTELNYDYFISADVFVYMGDLTEVFRLIKSKNDRPGILSFSTEHTEKDGYHLQTTGRYTHSKSYIKRLCEQFNVKISHFSISDLRKEKGEFLSGGIYILNF